MGKTRDLFKKIRDTKGTFHRRMGTIKDRNGKDLIEPEEIKKGSQEYTEELYKKDLNDPDNHDSVVAHLEPDILECEVKRALGNITWNKGSGGDRISAELFEILKDDAALSMSVHLENPAVATGLETIHIQIPKKDSTKECSNQWTIPLISSCLKSCMLGFSIMQTKNFQTSKQGLEKAEIKLSTFTGSYRKLGSFKKISTSVSPTMLKPLTVWIITNCGKLLKK